jgi:hypothetical protein
VAPINLEPESIMTSRHLPACLRHALRIAAVTVGFGLTGISALAHADGALVRLLRPADAERLAGLDEARRAAVAAAQRHPDAALRAEFAQMMAGEPQTLRDGFDASGEWQCRIGRLSATGELAVFPWYRCRIDDDGAGWRLRKLDGSDRTDGRFYDQGERAMVYLGARGTPSAPAPRYGAQPSRDQVALAVRPGPDRLRLEFPRVSATVPFEVIELRRAPAPAAPRAPALRTRHGLTLQWIGWDRRGEALIERRDGRSVIRGEQRSADGTDYVTIEGEIIDFTGTGFTLRGRVVIRVGIENAGQPCTREGDLRFQAPPGRAYWRMQATRSPCSTLTDYVDVYF